MKRSSRIKKRKLEAVVQVHTSDYEPELGYTPHALVQAALPYRNSKALRESPAWVVENGNYALVIQRGYDRANKCNFDYPTGTLPRLLMYWMATTAKVKQTKRLELGGSLNEFLRVLGLNPATGGGKRSDAARLKKQMANLFRANISFEYKGQASEGDFDQWLDMKVTAKGNVLWSTLFPNEPTLFENWIELSDNFYDFIVQKSVPVDMNVLHHIQNSPMALDLYTWVTYRAYAAYKSGKSKKVPWISLQQQLGSSFDRLRDFRRKAQNHLTQIQLLYPDLHMEETDDSLVIKPSKPAIIDTTSQLPWQI